MNDERMPFVVCYDYGTGGLWGVMVARDRQEILDKYPELAVFVSRPEWMSADYWAQLSSREPLRMDAPPTGLLKVLLEDRDSGGDERRSNEIP